MKVQHKHTAVHGFVSGRVQGVGFRYSTVHKAASLNISGWVRNTPRGEVEFFAQGAPAAVSQMIDWLRKGPSMARVDNLNYDTVAPKPGVITFRVTY